MNAVAGRTWGVLLALSAGACAPPRAQHTVDAYRADAGLRGAQLEHCANDPGTLHDTPDCVNAREAERRESARSLRELPPVMLPREGRPDATPVAPGAPVPNE